MNRCVAALLAVLLCPLGTSAGEPAAKGLPYRELTGRAEGFAYVRQWRSYYWREDFTLLVRADGGRLHRVISREPTPWTEYRLGTTYTGLAVDWVARPRVQVIGVQGVDRDPAEFPD